MAESVRENRREMDQALLNYGWFGSSRGEKKYQPRLDKESECLTRAIPRSGSATNSTSVDDQVSFTKPGEVIV